MRRAFDRIKALLDPCRATRLYLIMPLNEADTRAKMIDPGIRSRRWTGTTSGVNHAAPHRCRCRVGRARRRGSGRRDYLLRYRLNPGTQPVVLALIGPRPRT